MTIKNLLDIMNTSLDITIESYNSKGRKEVLYCGDIDNVPTELYDREVTYLTTNVESIIVECE